MYRVFQTCKQEEESTALSFEGFADSLSGFLNVRFSCRLKESQLRGGEWNFTP